MLYEVITMTIKDEPKALHNDVFIETIFEQPACIASHFELKGNSSKNISYNFV